MAALPALRVDSGVNAGNKPKACLVIQGIVNLCKVQLAKHIA